LAAAGGVVEQTTSDVRVVDPPGVEVFELVEAAASAAVAHALPFGRGQLCKGLAAPKRHIVHRFNSRPIRGHRRNQAVVPRNKGITTRTSAVNTSRWLEPAL